MLSFWIAQNFSGWTIEKIPRPFGTPVLCFFVLLHYIPLFPFYIPISCFLSSCPTSHVDSGCVALLLHRQHQALPGRHMAALWEPSAPHRHVSCLTSAHQQDVWCTCLLAGLFWFTNQFFFYSFLLSYFLIFFHFLFNPYCPSVGGVLVFTLFFFFGFVYSACSVCGVVMRLMRTRFPLRPGKLTWRRCTPAAQQSRYNSGIFAPYLAVFIVLMSRFTVAHLLLLSLPCLTYFIDFTLKYTLWCSTSPLCPWKSKMAGWMPGGCSLVVPTYAAHWPPCF